MTNGFSESTPPSFGAPEARADRIRREAAFIMQAHARLDAGQGIDEADCEAWLDALDLDENAPMPSTRPNTKT